MKVYSVVTGTQKAQQYLQFRPQEWSYPIKKL